MTENKTQSNKLDEKHKYRIIQMLAAFEEPVAIVEHLKAQYDIEVSERNIYYYGETRKGEIKTERERLRDDLLAIPIANRFYRLRERQRLLDDLRENLWIGVPLTKNGKVMADEDGNAKLVRQRGNHASINQLLDSTMKEIEPLKLEIVHEESSSGPVNREEIARRIVSILTGCMSRRAVALGKKEPTKEEKAMMILELVEEPEDKK